MHLRLSDPLPLTFWATSLLVICCAALVGNDAWSWRTAGAARLEQAQRLADVQARALALQADATLRGAALALAGLPPRWPAAPGLADEPQLATSARALGLSALGWYDADGHWLRGAITLPPRATTQLGQQVAAYYRTHPTAQAVASVSLLPQPAIGGTMLVLMRPVAAANGKAAIALAAVDPAYFDAARERLGLGPAACLALLAGPAAGPAPAPSCAGGVLAWQALANYPVQVQLAQPSWPADDLSTAWRSVPLALLLAGCGALLVREIGRRLATEHRLLGDRAGIQRQNLKLFRLATQDSLTGLANRRMLDVTLQREFQRAARTGSSLAFIMIDVDRFKQYNDLYGHAAGDACLRAIGRVVARRGQSRPGDLAARYGGEEIAILLPRTDLHGAVRVADKMRKALLKLALPHSGSDSGWVTLSAGVTALVPQPGDVPTQLMVAADEALYAAKAGGRNRVRGVEYRRPA